MDYEQAMVLASDHFLTEALPSDWQDMDDEEVDEWIREHAWEPIEYWSTGEVYDMVDRLAQDFIRIAGER